MKALLLILLAGAAAAAVPVGQQRGHRLRRLPARYAPADRAAVGDHAAAAAAT